MNVCEPSNDFYSWNKLTTGLLKPTTMLSTRHNKPSSQQSTTQLPTLATIDPDCSIQLGRKFVPHIKITINILLNLRVDPTKVVCEALNNKKFDWNQTPLTRFGPKALIFYNTPSGTLFNPMPSTHGMSAHHWNITERWCLITCWQDMTQIQIISSAHRSLNNLRGWPNNYDRDGSPGDVQKDSTS